MLVFQFKSGEESLRSRTEFCLGQLALRAALECFALHCTSLADAIHSFLKQLLHISSSAATAAAAAALEKRRNETSAFAVSTPPERVAPNRQVQF